MKNFSLWALLAFAGCSTKAPPVAENSAPEWIHGPARTIDNGYIVYVGSGEASTDELAKFKAEAVALQDLANECSFVPKGTRVEDRYSRLESGGAMRESYVKVALDFESCEKAKHALDPDDLKNLANLGFNEEVKRYQEMIGADSQNTQAELVASQSAENAAAAAPNSTNAASTSLASSPTIRNDPEFFVVRQQIVYAKQNVILGSVVYVRGSPEHQSYVATLTESSQKVQHYTTTHPEILKTSTSWSSVQREIHQQALRSPSTRKALPETFRNPKESKYYKQKRRRKKRNFPYLND